MKIMRPRVSLEGIEGREHQAVYHTRPCSFNRKGRGHGRVNLTRPCLDLKKSEQMPYMAVCIYTAM